MAFGHETEAMCVFRLGVVGTRDVEQFSRDEHIYDDDPCDDRVADNGTVNTSVGAGIDVAPLCDSYRG